MSTVNTSKKTQLWNVVSSPVHVDEPTVEDTISILRGLKERYEVYHGVKITDSALVSAGNPLGSLYHGSFPSG